MGTTLLSIHAPTCSIPHNQNCAGADRTRKYIVLNMSPVVHIITICKLGIKEEDTHLTYAMFEIIFEANETFGLAGWFQKSARLKYRWPDKKTYFLQFD